MDLRPPEAGGAPAASFRLAAYAICSAGERVLIVRCISPDGTSTWSLPGGRVEQGEDPFDTVIRELAEETGLEGVVERLLGVDSRVISPSESWSGGGHQNVGVFYGVRVTGGELRPEPDGAAAEPRWATPAEIATLRRSSLVDVGIALAQARPPTGHVDPVPVGGLIQH